jgi:hypothetical protein
MELKITRMETEEERVHLPGRAMHRNCLMSVNNCSFAAPGNYAIILRLRVENQEFPNDLAQRFLEVFQD